MVGVNGIAAGVTIGRHQQEGGGTGEYDCGYGGFVSSAGNGGMRMAMFVVVVIWRLWYRWWCWRQGVGYGDANSIMFCMRVVNVRLMVINTSS